MATNKAKINKVLAAKMESHGIAKGKSETAQLDAAKDFASAVANGKETNIGIEDARTYGDLFLQANERETGKTGTEKSANSFASQLAGFARPSVLLVAATNDPYAHLKAAKKAGGTKLAGRSLFQMACSVNTAIEKHFNEHKESPTVDAEFTSAVFAATKPRSTPKEKTPDELMAALLADIKTAAEAILTMKGVKRSKDMKAALTAVIKL